MRILLVEDNPINQKVARNLMEQMGYHADLAGNGVEALQALQRQPYDIVLMDVLMPEMDGLEATRRIRHQWPPKRQPRIIALTAVAMGGDRERCLAAGMDDYLRKPVQREELQVILERWGGVRRYEQRHEAASTLAVTNDFEGLLGLRAMQEGSEPDIVSELIALFLEDASQRLQALHRAAVHVDALAFERAAHSLKGSCASIGAKRMTALCADLERRGRTGQVTGLEPLLARLEAEFERVRCELEPQWHRS
jgi:CheY-like chemotaxis protein